MKAAIISRQGLGDGLMMMVCAYHLKKAGYDVTFFHDTLIELSDFFPDHTINKMPKSIDIFQFYDLIIIEQYTHKVIAELLKLKKNNIYVIHPSLNKQGLHNINPKTNFVCNKKKSIITNVLEILPKILGPSKFLEKTNGIKISPTLSYRKHKNRVVIHPTSNNTTKNWSFLKFKHLSQKLQKAGYQPVFSMSPKELLHWHKKTKSIQIKTFKNLKELAEYIFESGYLIGNDSGPAHLSSNLNIPTLVIASNANKMKLWKPDFYPSQILTAPSFIPNIKNLRLRDKYWSFFISTKKAYQNFEKLHSSSF